MVANGQNIVVDILEDGVRDVAVRLGGVRETGPIVQVTYNR